MPPSVTKVLIAVDDTAESVAAAALARRLFRADAEYLAINVFEHPPATRLPGSTPDHADGVGSGVAV
jgi:hypothetical protein